MHGFLCDFERNFVLLRLPRLLGEQLLQLVVDARQLRVGRLQLCAQVLVLPRQLLMPESPADVGAEQFIVPRLDEELVNRAFVDGVGH